MIIKFIWYGLINLFEQLFYTVSFEYKCNRGAYTQSIKYWSILSRRKLLGHQNIFLAITIPRQLSDGIYRTVKKSSLVAFAFDFDITCF